MIRLKFYVVSKQHLERVRHIVGVVKDVHRALLPIYHPVHLDFVVAVLNLVEDELELCVFQCRHVAVVAIVVFRGVVGRSDAIRMLDVVCAAAIIDLNRSINYQ